MPDYTTITGVPTREIYRSDDFCIVRLAGKKNQIVIGDIPPADLKFGLRYQFSGRWETHPQHGERFKIDGYALKQPTSRAGLLKYLETFDGIGVKRAQQIVDRFGVEDCLGKIRSTNSGPDAVFLLQIFGTAEAVIELRESITQHNTETRVELLGILSGRGFPSSLITELIRKFGIAAPTRIRSDPFLLLQFSGSGFLRCDALWRDLGLPLDSPVRARHCVRYCMRQNRSGDSWIAAHGLLDSVRSMLGVDTGRTAQDAISQCISEGVIAYVCVEGRYWVADAEENEAEQQIAMKLGELVG